MSVDAAGNSMFLPAGTYWVDFHLGGTTASGPFVPPVTPAPGGANAQQFNGTAWVAAVDTGVPQEIPFQVDYTIAPGPGSLALLGLAGLFAKRRRRS
jgi:hypothetical protein